MGARTLEVRGARASVSASGFSRCAGTTGSLWGRSYTAHGQVLGSRLARGERFSTRWSSKCLFLTGSREGLQAQALSKQHLRLTQ